MRYQFAEFLLDLNTGELKQADKVVPLRRQTLRLLQVLVAAAPALLSRDQLLDEVWGRSALSPNALPQAISELRRALGDDAESPRFIDTRRGLGYRFMADVVVLDDPAPNPTRASEPPLVNPQARTVSASRAPWLIVSGLLALLAAIGAAWQWRAPQEPVAANSLAQQNLRLAIAPFPADAAVPAWVPDAALELLGQSLQSERLTLYRSDTLGISSQNDAARWQHQARDLLGASHALSGRWRSAADGNLYLDVSVLDLTSGQVLVSRQLDAPMTEFDQLVTKASLQIADTLKVVVSRARADGEARLTEIDRSAYWSALAALAQDNAAIAVEILVELHAKLGEPAWLEPDLARAQVQAQQFSAAQQLLASRLQRSASLPLGERLRIQAQLADLRFQPTEAAAARRALAELYPDDVENWINLVRAELDALQGATARATLAKLLGIAHAQTDPRLHLLRARLALVDNDYAQAQAEADVALEQARRYDLPTIAIGAALEKSDALSSLGEVKAAAAFLAEVSDEWSGRAGAADRFALGIRQINLLRIGGDLSALPALFAQLEVLASAPPQRVRWGIEQALLLTAHGQHAEALGGVTDLEQMQLDIGDPVLSISWHDARAVISLARNDVEQARQEFGAAFALARRMGQERFSAPLQVNAGMLLARQRRFVEADAMWNSALEVFTKLGDRRGQATCLGNLAASAAVQGRPEQSRELNTQALVLFRELGVTDAQARTAYNLALNAARLGQITDAAALFAEARGAWLAGAQLDLAIRAAVGEAELTLLAAKPAAALEILNVRLPATDSSSALSRAALRATRASVALAQGDVAQAHALQQQALDLRKEAGSESWTTLSELDLLRLDWLRGADPTRVQVRAEALAQRFVDLKETRDAARAWLLVAETRLHLGQQASARQALEQVQLRLNEFADRPLELDLAWVSAWAAPMIERPIRLETLRTRALDEGYLLTVAAVDAALSKATVSAEGDESLMIVLPPYAQRE